MRDFLIDAERLRTVLVDICCTVTVIFLAVTGIADLAVHACAVLTFGDCVWRVQRKLLGPVRSPDVPAQGSIHQRTKDLTLNTSSLALRDVLVSLPEADPIVVVLQDLPHHLCQLTEGERGEGVRRHCVFDDDIVEGLDE